MSRQYIKKSSYWEQQRRNVAAAPVVQPIINVAPPARNVTPRPMPDIGYGSTEISRGSAIPGSNTNVREPQVNNYYMDPDAFQNIRAMQLPYASYGDNRDYYGVKDAIELCNRAYSGVPALRNAIEIAVEFSSQPLYLKTENQTVKTFFQEWFHAVEMNKLKEQFFREYYRSGNVFLYKFSGKFGPAYYKNFQQSFGAVNNRIPIRYTLLNPANVFVPTGLTFPYTYVRLLSIYEIERLRHPITEQDKQVYNDLPQFVKDQINVTAAYPLGIYIPMDPTRLRFAFYKKQSYEPLAIPMGFPVLPSIEWKLVLTKMDKQLARTVEQAILLVKTGETGTEWNGGNGINPNNIARLQSLFNNQTVGRVLVADFTTEAEWLIPNIWEILGPQKYEVVNQDILDGLQSILGGGDDKFANAQMKSKIFIQRLKEGQDAFLHDFLIPEIVQICEDMGFRTVPKVKFRKIDLQDDVVAARVYAQLGQLGILTADQVVKAMETNILPDKDEMDSAQTKYKTDRDDGKYLPLVGASMQDDPDAMGGQVGGGGRPPGKGPKIPNKKVGPIGKSKGAFSIKAYTENLRSSQVISAAISEKLKKKYKVKELDKAQSGVVESLVDIVMATRPKHKWNYATSSIIDKPTKIPAEISKEINEIAEEYDVDNRDAILLFHSKAKKLPDES